MLHRQSKQLYVVKSVRHPKLVNGFNPIEAAMLRHSILEDHRNIIKLFAYDYITEIDVVQYYFEYCSGGDLHQLCDQYQAHRTKFPEAFIWKVFLQICGALEHLHRGFYERDSDRLGIVHRDVKPENIFFRRSLSNKDDYPDVVLADFGCASFNFATYDPSGTPAWQGPETPRKSPKGDVWSLGAVIHLMIYMELPIIDLPTGIERTRENLFLWDSNPNSKAPITGFPDCYSAALIVVMLTALELNYNKRTTSARLLTRVREAIRDVLVIEEGTEDRVIIEPLEPWAFDHMHHEREHEAGTEQSTASPAEDEGWKQYMEMMMKLATEEQIMALEESLERSRGRHRVDVDDPAM